jgi:hypothetical protein
MLAEVQSYINDNLPEEIILEDNDSDNPLKVPFAEVKTFDDKLPDINQNILDDLNLNLCNLDDIKSHFDNLFNNNCRLSAVLLGGKKISNDEYPLIKCDFCASYDEWAVHCKKCDKKLCSLCLIEKTEEIAKKNGAKNWHKRKDALLECFEHEKQGFYEAIEVTVDKCVCDVCGDYLQNIESLSCRMHELDICSKCFNTENAKKLKDTYPDYHGYNIWFKKETSDQKLSGNILNFIPLLTEKEDSILVLYNVSQSDPYYHQCMVLIYDDHGRTAMYHLNESLDEILAEMKTYAEKRKTITKPSWQYHYGSPIIQLAVERDLDVYFG